VIAQAAQVAQVVLILVVVEVLVIKSAQVAKEQSLFNLDLKNKVNKNLVDIEKKIDSAILKGETYTVLYDDDYNEPSWFMSNVLKNLLDSNNSDNEKYLTLMALKGLGYICSRVVGTETESSAFGNCQVQTSEIRVSWS
jgi:hypothetical protein